MATDYVTSPLLPMGKVIFGIGCGLITMLIRIWGQYPEGVSFSILLMNCLTPLINNFAEKRMYGGAK
jgi:electron transport complex protein RnfD